MEVSCGSENVICQPEPPKPLMRFIQLLFYGNPRIGVIFAVAIC